MLANRLSRSVGSGSRYGGIRLVSYAPRALRPTTLVAARKRSPVSEGLSTVLKDELKIEKERYRTPDAVLQGPPFGFELEERDNSNMLMLTRAFGDEEIFVEVDLDSQEEEEELEDLEEDEGESPLPPISFLVNIVKKGKMLVFSCQTAGEDIVINRVGLNEPVDEDDAPPYTGPVFDELDDTLQQAFADYLEERGINGEFGYYLMELVHDKLEVEYMNWLTRVQNFVSS